LLKKLVLGEPLGYYFGCDSITGNGPVAITFKMPGVGCWPQSRDQSVGKVETFGRYARQLL